MKITIKKSEQPIISSNSETMKKISDLLGEIGISDFQLEVATAPEEEAAAVNWITSSVGQKFDTDGSNGAQCKDYANAYASWLGHSLKPSNAAETWTIDQDPFWAKIPLKTGEQPRAGDIVIWDAWKENQYGHIAVVLDASADIFRSVDQNWKDSNLETGSPATIITHDYKSPKILGYLRPSFES